MLLPDEPVILVRQIERLLLPRAARLGHPRPSIEPWPQTKRAAGADDGDCRFVGRLVLIERVAREYRAVVPREDVDGVLHVHALQPQVGRVDGDARDRTDEPLAEVEAVREPVLNSAAALGT